MFKNITSLINYASLNEHVWENVGKAPHILSSTLETASTSVIVLARGPPVSIYQEDGKDLKLFIHLEKNILEQATYD